MDNIENFPLYKYINIALDLLECGPDKLKGYSLDTWRKDILLNSKHYKPTRPNTIFVEYTYFEIHERVPLVPWSEYCREVSTTRKDHNFIGTFTFWFDLRWEYYSFLCSWAEQIIILSSKINKKKQGFSVIL